MTIAIIMKVNDGLILATDSASTIVGTDESGNRSAVHVYFNANKLFNLKKGYPVGCMTWGNGSIGDSSVATLVKDFREKYNPENNAIDVSSITQSFKKFISKKIEKEKIDKEMIGFVIAGYSSKSSKPEIYSMEITADGISDPIQINKDEPIAVTWFGDTEITTRLLLGMSSKLDQLLKDNDLDNNLVEKIIENIKNDMQLPIGVPAMPIQDAIDFVMFLADISCKMSKFMAGAQIIGGSIDLAVITKHEKFKWINRKHYFEEKLNKGDL
jgi:hypothetical protein